MYLEAKTTMTIRTLYSQVREGDKEEDRLSQVEKLLSLSKLTMIAVIMTWRRIGIPQIFSSMVHQLELREFLDATFLSKMKNQSDVEQGPDVPLDDFTRMMKANQISCPWIKTHQDQQGNKIKTEIATREDRDLGNKFSKIKT